MSLGFQKLKPFFWGSFGCFGVFGASWQYKRRSQKLEYLNTINKCLNENAIECPTILTENEIRNEYKFKKVYLEGIPDYNNEIYIQAGKPPKYSRVDVNEYINGSCYIYTPIKLNNGNIVLINRGWTPIYAINNTINNEKILHKNQNGLCKFEGLIMPFPKLPKNITKFDIKKKIWPYLNNEIINKKLNIENENSTVICHIMNPELNKDMKYPIRLHKNDLIGVSVPPMQHSLYIVLMSMVAIWSFTCVAMYIRNPNLVVNAVKNSQNNRAVQKSWQRLNTQRK